MEPMEILLCVLEVNGYSEPLFIYLAIWSKMDVHKKKNVSWLETLQQNGGPFMFFVHPIIIDGRNPAPSW